MNEYIAVIILGVAAYSAVHYYERNIKGKKKAAAIKIEYDQAIKSGDRELALKLGRDYYATLRGGKLSIYDEQAIANDLSTIKS